MATARCRPTRRRWCSRWRSPTTPVARARSASWGRARRSRTPRHGRRGGWSCRPTAAFGCPAARTGGRRSPRPTRPCGRASRRGSWRCWASMIRAARTRWRRRDSARRPPRSCGGPRRRRRWRTARPRARRCSTNARTRSRPARSTSRNGSRWPRGSAFSAATRRPARALEAARATAGAGAPRAACAERDAWLRARRGDTEGASRRARTWPRRRRRRRGRGGAAGAPRPPAGHQRPLS